MKHFHMQTLFGITSTGLNDAVEQHTDVAGTHYVDSSEQYITKNVEQWTGWNAQWKFTEVSGWNLQQQYMGLMSTVQTLSKGNASMQNEDIFMGMNATIADKQMNTEAHDNWNCFCVTHLMMLWMAMGRNYEYWIRHTTVKGMYDTFIPWTYTIQRHVLSLSLYEQLQKDLVIDTLRLMWLPENTMWGHDCK
jgi:hypothetical protein